MLLERLGALSLGRSVLKGDKIVRGRGRALRARIYNFLPASIVKAISNKKTGENIVIAGLAFRRLEDVNLDGYHGVVIEGALCRVAGCRYGGDIRVLVERRLPDGWYTYMVGAYYYSVDDIHQFESLLSSLRFDE